MSCSSLAKGDSYSGRLQDLGQILFRRYPKTAGCHGRYSARAVVRDTPFDQNHLVIRKRLQRHDAPGTARFLTFSCYQRYPLFGNDAIKAEFVDRLERVSTELAVAVLAWVIMPNHIHLIVFSETTAIDDYLHKLKGPFSQFVLRRWRALGAPILHRLQTPDGHRFWQAGGGYDRNVMGEELLEKVRYCHNNPVKHGLADTTVDWPWSSARRYDERDDALGPAIAFDLVPRSRRWFT